MNYVIWLIDQWARVVNNQSFAVLREHSFFVILANNIHSSKLWFPNTFNLIILFQSSALNFYGPAAPFVLADISWIRTSVTSSNMISLTSFTRPFKRSASNIGLASRCFTLRCFLYSSVRPNTLFSHILTESSLTALFTFPVLMKYTRVLQIYSGFL